MLTGMLVSLAGLVALAFAWSIMPSQVASGSDLTPQDVARLLFVICGLLVVGLGLWLFLDIRAVILLMSGPLIVGLTLGSEGSFFLLPILPAALCFAWAGLASLDKHPIDRWFTVVAAIVLSIGLGPVGILAFSPVAVAAALVPMLQFGAVQGEEAEVDDTPDPLDGPEPDREKP
jgi:hypothetical protein